MTKETMNKVTDEIVALGYECETKQVNKNGNIINGWVVGQPGNNVRPVIYYYPEMEELTISEIVSEVLRIYKASPTLAFNVNDLTWDNLRNKIIACVRHHYNDDYATMPLLDMDIIFRIQLNDEMTIPISNALLNQLDVTLDDLYAQAKENAVDLYKSQNIIERLGLSLEGAELFVGMVEPMKVISSRNYKFGAGVLAFPELLKEIIDDDVVIIPSSIHEVLTIPAASWDYESLKGLVTEINATDVTPEEVLTNSVYVLKNGELLKVA